MRNGLRRAYATVLYIQLRNGLRIYEAVQAALIWARTRERRIKVRAEKSGYERPVIIPRELGEEERRLILAYIDEKADARIKTWCRRFLGYNTHALRYAFISWMARQGYPAQLIARITGHTKLDYILYYTQRVKAEEILERINL